MFNEIYTMQFVIVIQIKNKVAVAHCLSNNQRSRKKTTISVWTSGIMAFKNILHPHKFFWLPESRTICLDGWVPIQKLVEPLPLSRDARYQWD